VCNSITQNNEFCKRTKIYGKDEEEKLYCKQHYEKLKGYKRSLFSLNYNIEKGACERKNFNGKYCSNGIIYGYSYVYGHVCYKHCELLLKNGARIYPIREVFGYEFLKNLDELDAYSTKVKMEKDYDRPGSDPYIREEKRSEESCSDDDSTVDDKIIYEDSEGNSYSEENSNKEMINKEINNVPSSDEEMLDSDSAELDNMLSDEEEDKSKKNKKNFYSKPLTNEMKSKIEEQDLIEKKIKKEETERLCKLTFYTLQQKLLKFELDINLFGQNKISDLYINRKRNIFAKMLKTYKENKKLSIFEKILNYNK